MSEGFAWLLFAAFMAAVCGWLFMAIRNAGRDGERLKQADSKINQYQTREEVENAISAVSVAQRRAELLKWVRPAK